MKTNFNLFRRKLSFTFILFSTGLTFAQTNVFDDIISQSPNHTYLTAALQQQGLAAALQDQAQTLTVFAPTDEAFEALADELNTDIAGLLLLPNLSDILLYHVVGTTNLSSSLSNGQLLLPLNVSNTVKISITLDGVYANHAEVSTADLTSDNGVVHVIDEVILPNETVVDLGLNNPGFEILLTAIIEQGLVPVLSNPFEKYTVLAPTDEAFIALLTALNITAEQLLGLPDLTDILLYHVLDTEVEAADLSNGMLPVPINDFNTLKVTIDDNGLIFFNQAQVVTGDVFATNGVVHALNSVLLPYKTVVDVAIDNDFTYLTTALIQEKLLPTLTNPLGSFTVFAPTNNAFEELADLLNTDIAGLLALPNLTDILLYHVAPGTLESTDLVNGPLTMISGDDAIINTTGGVAINQATVTSANIEGFNGIVHVIDQVILPNTANIDNFENSAITTYPNPSSTHIQLDGVENAQIRIVAMNSSEVMNFSYDGNPLNISKLDSGVYFIHISNEQIQQVIRFIKQ